MVKLSGCAKNNSGEVDKMAENKQVSLQEFIDSVNKKPNKVNGKKITFAFTKRKRKTK